MRVFHQTVNRIVAPRLAALGFERNRNLWNRRRWLWMDAIEVQQSTGNTKLEGRFTVNLAAGLRRRDCGGGDGGGRLTSRNSRCGASAICARAGRTTGGATTRPTRPAPRRR